MIWEIWIPPTVVGVLPTILYSRESMLPLCPVPKKPRFCSRVYIYFTEGGNNDPAIPNLGTLARVDGEDAKAGQVAKSVSKDAT